MTDDPKIYVASLSDYNNGTLHGAWIELDGKDASEVSEEITAMLEASPSAKAYGTKAEEYAIHDHDGFGGLSIGEYDPIGKLVEKAEVIVEHGEDVGAGFLVHAADFGWELDSFEDRSRGLWASFAEYAEELFDDVFGDVVIAAEYSNYLTVDHERFARDLETEMATVETREGVWVFAIDV